MKTKLFVSLLLFLFIAAVAQDSIFNASGGSNSKNQKEIHEKASNESKFVYRGRFNPAAQKEILETASYVSDISPELWTRLSMPRKERFRLDSLRKIVYPLGYYLYPIGGYNSAVEYVSVEISSTHKDLVLTASNVCDQLTTLQKSILFKAEFGEELSVKIKFRLKNLNSRQQNSNPIITGSTTVTVIPNSEASFPGGYSRMSRYINDHVRAAASTKNVFDSLQGAVLNFTVNPRGQLTHVSLIGVSNKSEAAQIILKVFSGMPLWNPASNKGQNVAQKFSIPLGNIGC
ncbi:MAG: hypothetical protein IPP32_08780 [Bacteroidetes bacterium]|nr:hypothetical protein [Bacteroidota bacterium]